MTNFTQPEIALRKPAIANVESNSKLQTAIHAQKDISAIQSVVRASVIWMEHEAIIVKRQTER